MYANRSPVRFATTWRVSDGSMAWRRGARQLGWQSTLVIDEDLGRTGTGGSERPGFERMLSAVCRNEIGVILAVDASRLARNGPEWQTLIEFCGLVGCLLADEQSVFDPRVATDRAMLGIQGVMSELELSNIMRRSMEGLRRKAERGELFLQVAVGYRRAGRDVIEKDPDLRVQAAISLVFERFAELQSIRQVHIWLHQEGLELPTLRSGGEGAVWKPPTYKRVHSILTNPVYAGAYVFGRTGTRVSLRDGRKRVTRGHWVPREDWQVLIKEHHEGYVCWEQYERNQRVIADNRTKMPGVEPRGAVRAGEALLAGLLRCGHCGRRMHVVYCGKGGSVVRYQCYYGHLNRGEERCISFGGLRVDEAVGREVARVLQPIGVEAALLAIEDDGRARMEAIRQRELALERALHEARRVERQYDAVDPENRQVAGELERRWNARLTEVRQIEAALAASRQEVERSAMSIGEREACLVLGENLERAWFHPWAGPEIRKRILRAVLEEVVARVKDGRIELLLHWRGGDHTELSVRKQATGKHRYTVDVDTERVVTGLARLMPDGAIASLLNRLGRRTGKGKSWTEANVRAFRHYRHIPVFRQGERRQRNEFTLAEAAERLGVSKWAMHRLIRNKQVPATQLCKGAPWVISGVDLAALEDGARTKHRPYPVLDGFEGMDGPLAPGNEANSP